MAASLAADFGSPQEISGGRVMPGAMPFRIQRFFKPALVLLILAAGIWIKLSVPLIKSTGEDPGATHRKWINTRMAEKLNRRMRQHHRDLMTKAPQKRKVCSYGTGDCCFIPKLAGIWPLPEPFGGSETKPIELLPEFKVVN